jgi:hypothetical protein
VRPLWTLGLTATLLLAAVPARAQTSPAAAAFLSGAATLAAGFVAGGFLIGAGDSNSASQENAGWLTIEAGFAVAPLVAHGVAGSWGRGAAFSAAPLVAFGGTAAVFQTKPSTIEHGSIEDQRVIWSLFGVGLLSGVAGVIDAVLASDRPRSIALAPLLGPGRMGLVVGATL